MRYISICVLRFFFRAFYIFPIKKNKCVLTSFNGRLYSCNPKYITEGLLKCESYDIYYALNDMNKKGIPDGVRVVKYKSLKHFFHLMTAKCIVFNSTGLSCFLPYRKKQIVIQTWHGGYSFKVIGNDFDSDKESIKLRQLTGSVITYFLSGSHLATQQHSVAMSTPEEKFLEIGLPRNDVLLNYHEDIKNKIYKEFEIDITKGIVLYAPTFREGVGRKGMEDYHLEQIDDQAVVEALNMRFSRKFVFMYKSHHNMLHTNIGREAINASDYDDIQELMCAADVIITDYSSCMADFALQKKLGFVYAPDLKEYESAHPFSMDPKDWPYKITRNNKELINSILSCSTDEWTCKLERFFNKVGNCEDGHATERIIEMIRRA